jgi:hypothetical protein
VRKIVVILGAVAALALAAPAAVQEGHGSCQAWGAAVAELAQQGGVGELVSGIATGGAGAVADAVAAEHAATCAAR